MNQLPRFKRGQQLTANELNTLVDAINARTILPSAGVLVRQTTNGVTLSAQTPKASGVDIHPFQLFVVSGTTTKVRVIIGTLGGGSALDIKVSPTGDPAFSEGDNPPFLITLTSSGVIQGGVEVNDDGEITSRWIEFAASLSDKEELETSTRHYVEIGTVSHDEETNMWSVANSCYGPISANVCRDWFSNPPTYGVTFQSPVSYA